MNDVAAGEDADENRRWNKGEHVFVSLLFSFVSVTQTVLMYMSHLQ